MKNKFIIHYYGYLAIILAIALVLAIINQCDAIASEKVISFLSHLNPNLGA